MASLALRSLSALVAANLCEARVAPVAYPPDGGLAALFQRAHVGARRASSLLLQPQLQDLENVYDLLEAVRSEGLGMCPTPRRVWLLSGQTQWRRFPSAARRRRRGGILKVPTSA